MTDPASPILTSAPSPRRGLRARIVSARRRAALITSTALLATGAGLAVVPDVAEAGLKTPLAVEAPLALPPAVPVVAVSDHREAGETGEAIGGGRASYYGAELAGNATASGERFDPSGLTAAHRTLPFGTRLRVTHAKTGESVVVRVNDRGPFHASRVIDVSKAAADAIGLTRSGTAEVTLERLPDAPRGTRG